MRQFIRLATGAFATAATLLAAAPVRAQMACDKLPNPIVVTGSADFEPVLREFAVRMAAETPPATIINVAAGDNSTSCAAVAGLVTGTDFGGLPGRYYARSGTTIESKSCMFAAGQTAHIAISEVFYETCSAAPQPKPADIADVLGPVQATVLVGFRESPTRYVTHEEARTIFGCGVSSTRTVAGVFNDRSSVFCRDPSAGTQITLARNLGLADATFPACQFYSNDAKLLLGFVPIPRPSPEISYMPAPGTIGFSTAGAIEHGAVVGSWGFKYAFQARGQKEAYYPDSSSTVVDRKNVRDGHYPIWGYIHLISKMTGGTVGPQAAELIGWINGTKTSPNINSFALEVGAGLIPQCAMKVKRSADGGPLSPYSPPETCHCALEAAATLSLPAGCTPCASNSGCPCGSSCRHGFCE